LKVPSEDDLFGKNSLDKFYINDKLDRVMGDSKWLGFFIPPSTVVDITRRQLTTTLPQARGESNDSISLSKEH
jgi:hypothetical protein